MRLLAVALSGLAYGATFPPLEWHVLAWVALVPFLVAIDGVSPRRAALLGWCWGTIASYAVGDWFARGVAEYWGQPPAVGIALFFVVSTLTGGLEYAAFAALHARLARGRAANAPLFVAAGWVAAELGRARLFGGNPWALAGYSQAGVLPVMQIADVAGVYGVSFCLVVGNAAVAQAWTRRGEWRGLATAGATLAAVLAYGAFRLTAPSPAIGPPTRVAVVQGDVPVSGRWDPERYGRNLDVYLGLTERTFAERPALVVWPESALTFFLPQEPAYRSAIARVLVDGGVELLTGGPRPADHDAGIYNAAFLLGADGETRAVSDKRVLLPFGEYFPFAFAEDLLQRRPVPHVRAFVSGPPSPPLPTAAGRAGVLICNEAFFPDLAAERVRDGAEYFVVLANDSWARSARYAGIAASMAAFRAVEFRRDVVRASTSGPSVVVDATGRVAIATDTGRAEAATAEVLRHATVTPYAIAGDGFALLAVAVGAARAIYRRRSRRHGAAACEAVFRVI